MPASTERSGARGRSPCARIRAKSCAAPHRIPTPHQPPPTRYPKTKRVHVRFFAALAEIAGQRETDVGVPAGATVVDAFERLQAEHPGLASYAGRVLFAVNAAYAEPAQPLRDGDDLALIPPVSGGST